MKKLMKFFLCLFVLSSFYISHAFAQHIQFTTKIENGGFIVNKPMEIAAIGVDCKYLRAAITDPDGITTTLGTVYSDLNETIGVDYSSYFTPKKTGKYTAIIAGATEYGTQVNPITTEFTVVKYGDIDLNNEVNSIDLAKFRLFLLGQNKFDAAQRFAADVNGDSEVNSLDFGFLRKYLLGDINHFPAEGIYSSNDHPGIFIWDHNPEYLECNNPYTQNDYPEEISDLADDGKIILRENVVGKIPVQIFIAHHNATGSEIGYGIQLHNHGFKPVTVKLKNIGFGSDNYEIYKAFYGDMWVKTITIPANDKAWILGGDSETSKKFSHNASIFGVVRFEIVEGDGIEVNSYAYKDISKVDKANEYIGYVERLRKSNTGSYEYRYYKGTSPNLPILKGNLYLAINDSPSIYIPDYSEDLSFEAYGSSENYLALNSTKQMNENALGTDMLTFTANGHENDCGFDENSGGWPERLIFSPVLKDPVADDRLNPHPEFANSVYNNRLTGNMANWGVMYNTTLKINNMINNGQRVEVVLKSVQEKYDVLLIYQSSYSHNKNEQFPSEFAYPFNSGSLSKGKEIILETFDIDPGEQVLVNFKHLLIPMSVNGVKLIVRTSPAYDYKNSLNTEIATSLNGISNNIYDNAKSGIIKSFPNPSNGQVTLTYNLPGNAENSTIKLYNIIGRQVKEFKILNTGQSSIDMDLKDLPSGIYNCVMYTNDSKVDETKIVIAK